MPDTTDTRTLGPVGSADTLNPEGPYFEALLFDCCGKCVPWYCCGSTRFDHEPGCAEEKAFRGEPTEVSP